MQTFRKLSKCGPNTKAYDRGKPRKSGLGFSGKQHQTGECPGTVWTALLITAIGAGFPVHSARERAPW